MRFPRSDAARAGASAASEPSAFARRKKSRVKAKGKSGIGGSVGTETAPAFRTDAVVLTEDATAR